MRRLRNVRRVARWIRDTVSPPGDHPDYSRWRRTEGEIYSTRSGQLNNQAGTEISYSYRAGCARRSGQCWIVFSDESSARTYAALRPPGSKVIVRYDGLAPNQSVMLEKDQPNSNPLAVAMQGR